MTAQPCPKCKGQGYILYVYARGPSDPPGNARLQCGTRADPAPDNPEIPGSRHVSDNAQQGVREGDENTEACQVVDEILEYFDKYRLGSVAPIVAVIERCLTKGNAAKDAGIARLEQQLEAKDAEIERLKSFQVAAEQFARDMGSQQAKYDPLIRQLTDALRCEQETGDFTGQYTPRAIREAIAEAEKMTGGKR